MARYYHVRFGRFCSPEPIMGDPFDPQSWNRYDYARDNSIRIVDPSGMNWLSSFRGWLANAFAPGAMSGTTPPFISTSNGTSIWQKLEDAVVPQMSGGIIDESGGFGQGVLEDGAGPRSLNLDTYAFALQMASGDIAHAPSVGPYSFPSNLFPRAIRVLHFCDESICSRLRKGEHQAPALQDSLRIDGHPRVGIAWLRTPIGGWIAIVGEARGMFCGA